ncbi:preprotein translocase subunit SecA [Mycoplasmoides fastidiosum]|uniref:Protein translocase subunit SecA n=1 Tax=Mycoplasmoides fastidiosum TaxID=92758 RepID=A0ABU0LYQ6_9BACT|nr:preprotein translocase subunit SecA [Mycoplasmoides fastidiosum]UUD37747.1 preprotein translocase subunit SecA [Mycoplasmoides fastidiosum]
MKLLSLFENKTYILNKAEKVVNQTESYKDEMRALTNNQLRDKTKLFLRRLELGETTEDILPEALATVREAAYRAHGMFAYPVQLIGAIVIFYGDFAEMKTGEGKTLTVALANYIIGLEKRGVHVVTVNEYLVKRDAEFSRKILNFLGLTVGFNTSQLSRDLKRKMFACDVTYTTHSELGFDYLRDNMVTSYDQKVLRSLNFAIIDEGDSVLIDEARTPLIISGQPQENLSFYVQVDRFVKTLVLGDFKIDPESRAVSLQSSGIKKCENYFQIQNLYSFENSDLVHKINNALTANFVFENGKEYIVQDDKILLVDHFTGRILHGRSYNAGLHQAVQAKESVQIEPENIVVATITYQSFFRLYKKIASLSGTALSEEQEFAKTYNMIVVPIPTNRPVIRNDVPDVIFGTKNLKWEAVIIEIKKRFLKGQPVLVGTSSVDDSEIVHQRLLKEKIPHEVLNARNNATEAEIVARAGKKYSVTVSTNMAGRGTDIKISEEVKKLGGLLVIGTERNESRRIDDQLRGRSGRQGDPGESIFYISLEDDLFKRFATNRFEKLSQKIEDSYFDSKMFSKTLVRIQKKVESVNFDMRKNLIEYDQVLSYQCELIYKQRDLILTTKKNVDILKRIIQKVVPEVVKLFIDSRNTTMLNYELLAESLNEKMFSYPMFLPEDFFDLTINEAENFLILILNKMVDLKTEVLGETVTNNMIREILIHNLDNGWQKHISFISKLRDSVSLRTLEQKSPLNIYIEEADIAFEKLLTETGNNVILTFLHYNIPGINTQCYEYAETLRAQRSKKIQDQMADARKTDASSSGEANLTSEHTDNSNSSASELSALEQLQSIQKAAAERGN